MTTHSKIWLTAIVLCLVVIVLGGIAWITARHASRAALVDTIAQDCLGLSRALAGHAHRLREQQSTLQSDVLYAEIANLWNSCEPTYPGSYLCVIEAPGKLAVHTQQPLQVGKDVGHVEIPVMKEGVRTTVADLLAGQRDWAGENANLRGAAQIAGYAYQKDLAALVVVHVPNTLVESRIEESSRPWGYVMAAVLGLLVPAGICWLTHSHVQGLQRELKTAAELEAARDNYYGLLQTLPYAVDEVDLQGRITFCNKAYCEQLGRALPEIIGHDVWEFRPTLKEQQELKQREYTIPVIVMTAFARVPLAVSAMQQGAVSLLEKPCDDQELWDAIRKALNRDQEQRASVEVEEAIRSRFACLSVEETQVLKLVVDGKRNKAIANHLDISIRTVETRRQRIYRKLEVGSLAELVKLAVAIGLETEG